MLTRVASLSSSVCLKSDISSIDTGNSPEMKPETRSSNTMQRQNVSCKVLRNVRRLQVKEVHSKRPSKDPLCVGTCSVVTHMEPSAAVGSASFLHWYQLISWVSLCLRGRVCGKQRKSRRARNGSLKYSCIVKQTMESTLTTPNCWGCRRLNRQHFVSLSFFWSENKKSLFNHIVVTAAWRILTCFCWYADGL